MGTVTDTTELPTAFDLSETPAHVGGGSTIVPLTQEIDGEHHRIVLGPRQAAINPPGIWHTFDLDPADGPAIFMTITAGIGTDHRSR